MSKAYLLGALHDGTVRRKTVRISQKEEHYVLFLKRMVMMIGARAWTYREGKNRNLFIVEFSRSFLDGALVLTRADWIDYIRGYFDAEGGLPAGSSAEPYLYFAQKNRNDLEMLRTMLIGLRISCGRLHNPSRRTAPDYWRFYVSRKHIGRFAKTIGSWHPRKSRILNQIVSKRI